MKLRFECDVCGSLFSTADACGKCERAHEPRAFVKVVALIGGNTRGRIAGNPRSLHLVRQRGEPTICGMLKPNTYADPARDMPTVPCRACADVARSPQLM